MPLPLQSVTVAHSMDARVRSQLIRLDPLTRLEQRCNLEAMERITRENHHYDVDKVLAYAYSDPTIKSRGIQAQGAAMRSRGVWYKLSYSCRTKDNYLGIVSFNYNIGGVIPKKDWDHHYLVP
ncbi:DUF930 domain-containing protein [Ochrobactrum teleogrylli]|uniref:DUF930 domain-containing protein n=2 Tax=Ochrobactrum teleogrylli TaxID=2479765 RepID=A0ABY2XYD4_9HYPH|nr:DUF930 domain-containing protein [[Ochrobactrum] teleogrylli]